MISKTFRVAALAAMTLLGAAAMAEEPISAEWLYLSGDGAWVSRATELRKTTTALPLPVDALEASAFWWRSDQPGLTLNWQTPSRKGWLSEDTVVQVEGWSGSWTVVQLDDGLMVLAQAGNRRPLPKSQWHRLSWIVGQNIDAAFELTVTQPEEQADAFQYAWFDRNIGADISYVLDLGRETPNLRQQLVLHNQSDYTVSAPGYSYAQSRDEGRVMMTRDMSAKESDMAVGTPAPGDSAGQATLVSEQPLILPEQSHIWLNVQRVDLTDVLHQYRFHWSTRQSQIQPGQWSVQISTEDALPAMAGRVQIAVWDRQVAVLETEYRPQRANRATLELGASDMMTLATESLGGQEWLLTLTNRNSQSVEAVLELSHYDDGRQDQSGLTLPVPAQGEVQVRVRLRNDQLSARPE